LNITFLFLLLKAQKPKRDRTFQGMKKLPQIKEVSFVGHLKDASDEEGKFSDFLPGWQ